MVNEDNKAWNLANWIIIALAGIIGALVVAGYSSLKSESNANSATIYARLGQIENKVDATNTEVKQLSKDVTRIDTLQKMRLDKEAREDWNRKQDERSNGKGQR